MAFACSRYDELLERRPSEAADPGLKEQWSEQDKLIKQGEGMAALLSFPGFMSFPSKYDLTIFELEAALMRIKIPRSLARVTIRFLLP